MSIPFRVCLERTSSGRRRSHYDDIASCKIRIEFDDTAENQNKYPYPEDGLYFNGFYETAQSFLGGSEGYLIVDADLKYYYKFASQHVISPRIKIWTTLKVFHPLS